MSGVSIRYRGGGGEKWKVQGAETELGGGWKLRVILLEWDKRVFSDYKVLCDRGMETWFFSLSKKFVERYKFHFR